MANRTATLATAGLAVTAIMAGAAVAQPTIVSEAGYSITFNGNQQAFFSNTWDGTSQQAPNNIALSGQGSTAFASSQYGAGGHLTANANDGVYGNNRSWLSNLTGTDAFVGIAFPAAQSLSSIAWGRDNGRNNIATPTGGGDTNQSGGQFMDRSAGTYTLQFTTVASPDASTPEGDWTTLGTITLPSSASGGFSPWFRHEYDLRTSAGEPIAGVTGVRISAPFANPSNAQVLDEIEVYRQVWASGNSAAWSSTDAWQTAVSGGTSTTAFDGDSLTFAAATAGTQALTLGSADRGARSLSFTTADPVSFTAGGTDSTLTVGWVGDLTASSETPVYASPTLTMAASAGAVTIGSQSAGEQVPLALVLSQTWTNDSANTLTIHNAVSRVASDTTSRVLTLSGSGNYSVGGIADGGSAGTLGLTKSGSGTLTLTGSNSYTGASVFTAGTVAFNSAANQTLSGALSGAAEIVKEGAGTLALTGTSTHSGTFTINSGTVELGDTGQSARSRIVLADTAGATLALTGSEATIGLLMGGGTNGGNVQLNGATLRVASAEEQSQFVFNGVISGSGNLAVVGPRALRLNAVQTFTGSASVSSGVLVLQVDNTLPSTTPLTMTGGNLDISNRPQTLAGLEGSAGNVYSYVGAGGSGGVLTLDVASGDSYTFGGQLGAGYSQSAYGFSVVKAGPGTQVFSGSNAYTGTTTVSDGTLAINGSLGSSAVTVQSGGRLGGSGTIGGAVTIESGGVLAPGNSIESLTTGALSFADGATYEYEIDSSILSDAADFTKALGELSLTGTVDLAISDLAGSPTAFAPGTIFSLINYTSSWNDGLFSVDGSPIANGGTFTVGLNTWRLDYDAASGGSNFTGDYTTGSFVNIVVVPEPTASAIAAIGMALGAAALRRRRRA